MTPTRTGLFVLVLLAGEARAQTPRFESDVRPILEASCFRCHGEKKRADLDLRTAAGILKGGESGPAVVPGKADESRLLKMVHEGLMPPTKGQRLKEEQVALIRRWIEAGAPADKAAAPAVTQHDIGPL